MLNPDEFYERATRPGGADSIVTNASEDARDEHRPSRASGKRISHSRKETQELVDFKSFSQSLFNTMTWKLSSIFELQNGLYRIIPAPGSKTKETTDVEMYHKATNVANTVDQEIKIGATLTHFNLDLAKALQTSALLASKDEKLERFGFVVFNRTTPLNLLLSRFTLGATSDHNLPRDVAVRSMDYVLSFPRALLRSCVQEDIQGGTNISESSPRTTSIHDVVETFARLLPLDDHPQTIFTSLWKSIREAFLHSNTSTGQSVDDYATDELNDAEAAHLVNLSLGALVARVTLVKPQRQHDVWAEFASLRKAGRFSPDLKRHSLPVRRHIVEYMDMYDEELAVRLMRMTLATFTSRSFRANPSILLGQRDKGVPRNQSFASVFTDNIVKFMASDDGHRANVNVEHVPYGKMILEWARTVFHNEWDSKAEFSWASPVGSAIEFMRLLCTYLYDKDRCDMLTSFR